MKVNKQVSPTEVSNMASEIESIVNEGKSMVSSLRDSLYEIESAAMTLSSYNNKKVEGSTYLEQKTIEVPNSLTPITHQYLHFDTWIISHQDEVIDACSSLEAELSGVEDTLSQISSEAGIIDEIAYMITGYIHDIETQLGSTFDKSVSLSKLLNSVLLAKLYGTAEFGTVLKIPRYYQENYADVFLGPGKTVSSSGCGFTAMSMALSYLLGEKITPRELVSDWSKPYYVYNQGMSNDFPQAALSHYHLSPAVLTNDASEVASALKDGHPVLCGQDSGPFTRGKHIILLNGIDQDGKVYVNDPKIENSINQNYNNQGFTMNEINENANQYWILPKKKN